MIYTIITIVYTKKEKKGPLLFENMPDIATRFCNVATRFWLRRAVIHLQHLLKLVKCQNSSDVQVGIMDDLVLLDEHVHEMWTT